MRIANQSAHHWMTVAAYRGSDAADNEDAKQTKKTEKAAEQLVNKKKRKMQAERISRPPPNGLDHS